MSNYLDLLSEFFVTDFKLRYKHSYLGFLWVIIKPLSQYAILYVIWTSLFGNTANYASYLLIGIFTLSFFTEGVQFGLQSLFNKAHIILKVNFPREIVVFSSIAIAMVNFLINFGIYLLFRIVTKQQLFTNHWYYFLFGFVLLSILLLGIAFYTSIISIRMQDIKHLVELVLQLIFWATPVFYNLSQLPKSIASWLTAVNPLVTIIQLMRAGVVDTASLPTSSQLLLLTSFVLIFTTFGYVYFKRTLPKIAEFF